MKYQREVHMGTVRVLIADDNKAMRDVVTSILGAEFDVIRAVATAERH